MKLLRWTMLGGVIGLGGYWLVRYLRPEHSALVLNNSVVLITGASSGIGRAYANAFARRGARMVLASRRAELLRAVHKEIEPYAADVLIVPTDLADDAQLQNLVETTLQRYGQIDVLINNAGLEMSGPLQKKSTAAIRHLVEINTASAMCLTRLCLPSMLARRSGWIVNVASMAGRNFVPFSPVYTASKAGLLAFSDALRRQLEGTGVEVVSVLPSYTSTEMVPPHVERLVKQYGLSVDTADYVAEHTVDGLLKGRREIQFGGLIVQMATWAERHFPWLMSLVWRAAMTPEIIAASDYGEQ
jgi:short-subunit dehydrogenase